jgi:glyoxylase-like metal-dependent hydrolase (beta-lactamase superfamily II)
VTAPARRRELGRGERVLPGLWRLRLPLPWPGVPHCNAWAVAAGDGVVLFDTGMDEPGSFAHFERAMDQVNLKPELVRAVVCTHAHSDHYGQAGTIIDRSGAPLWMHPNWDHMKIAATDPDAALAQRIEVARQSGVPEEPLLAYQEARAGTGYGISRLAEPDHDLVDGVTIDTDLGAWVAYETPGHAPSHVVLLQPERRLLISGDHLLGRVSLYFDYGWSEDPVGEFLRSLEIVERLDVRLVMSGHGRTFTDVQAHIDANRALVRERLDRAARAVAEHGPLTGFAVTPRLFDDELTTLNASWLLPETLCFLRHLEATGVVVREHHDGEPDVWRSA